MKSDMPLYHARRPESKKIHKPGNLPVMEFSTFGGRGGGYLVTGYYPLPCSE